MNDYWKTSIRNWSEYRYFTELLKLEWKNINTEVSPYVEIFPNKNGYYMAYCSKKASYTAWHYVTAKLSDYRHKKKVEDPLLSYIWKQINRINSRKEYCITKYHDIPEEILKYFDQDREGLLELYKEYFKNEDWLPQVACGIHYGLPDLWGSSFLENKEE